ncbi:hypothetical protein H072_10934 [Dactylellina haptotyla CBS 200.50]|uniref:Uncharacterized protein n=1 Tax=Dactylellina haptotyla (strain CBS 200.50) TaxID=1284197 RepID=S7ZYW2_DACHA|nr:hypothetical protein H072_10934 [Dactylellina haptotyla CBS 200.50]
MLTNRVSESTPDRDPDDIDFFESSLTTIFGDVRNQHGDPGQSVTYTSPKYGGIKLGLADVNKEETRLFSHHLWNAGVEVAAMIENGELQVEGETVLELGAGAALPSLISALAGAKSVVITDYPAPEILENIKANINLNASQLASSSAPDVYGHTWGVLTEEVAQKYAHSFTRVIAADTLWMMWEHENLVKSMLHFLDDSNLAARVVVVAGLHTGRQKMANFWTVAVENGLEIENIKERDVDGIEREFLEDRGIEDITERKRWLTIGILKKKAP